MRAHVGQKLRFYPHPQDPSAFRPGPLPAIVVVVHGEDYATLNVFNAIEPTPLIRQEVYIVPPGCDERPVGQAYALWTQEDIASFNRHKMYEKLMAERNARPR